MEDDKKKKVATTKWAFADVKEMDLLRFSSLPSLDELYERALNSRKTKRELYEQALNAALENLCSWERMARADGFSVRTLTDMHNGSPHPVFSDDGKHVQFVQAYGVRVEDKREKHD